MRLGTALFHPFVRRLSACLMLAALLLPAAVVHAQDDTFTVTVGDKTDDHPNNPDQGFPEAYYIDGEEAAVLTLERGTTYTFQMQNVDGIHPFYISTSADGQGEGVYSEGVDGNFATGNETLTFTPSESTPDLLYYQCGSHLYMGWQINVVDEIETETFTASLSGDQAVPANASTGEGSVSAELDGNTLTVSGSFSGLTSDFNPDIAGGAHLHLALAGQNGGVDIPLNASVDDDGRSGTFEAADNTFTLEQEQVEALRARRYYVNIHTQDMPAGEIRGQLLADGATVHHAVLSGRAAVPANTSDGVGGALLELQDDELVVSGAFSRLDSDFNVDAAGGAHLHLAPIGENGSIEIPLTPSISDDNRSGTFEAADNTFTLEEDQRQALLDGELYVNIHTQEIAAGELRGQALPLSQRVFEASLSGNNAVSAVESAARGGVLAVLDEEAGELTVTGDFSDLTSNFNADIAGGAHLHLAPVGENGGIEIPLNASVNEDGRSGAFEAADNTFTLEEDQRQALLGGELYVNIHTQDVPSGELRGQVLPSTNVAPDAPTISAPTDSVHVVLNGSADELVVEWSSGDANFNDLFFRWQIATDESFETPVYTAGMTDAMLTFTPDSLRSILMGAGFRAGQTDSVFHRIVALDGSQWTAGDPLLFGFEMSLPDFERAIDLVEVAQGLTSPVTLVEAPDDSGRLFVVDQAGQIRIVHADGTLQEEPFLDISARMVELMDGFDERGLLGLAFHPDYADNGRFFVYYSAPLRDSAPDDWNHTSHISEFQVSADNPDQADSDSEQILLQVDQPQFNHDAGTIAFGPDDGNLYIALGDGGGANDTGQGGDLVGHVDDWYDFNDGGNGQDVEQNLLGSILRIDVDGGDPYGVPDDNPFVGRDGLDEIWAYGFRNPYRFSFDQGGDHMLLVGDAGQGRWEEVSRVEQGGNYGWNVYEGTHCFDASSSAMDAENCPETVGEGHPDEGEPLIDPVIEYANSNQGSGLGLVVVGGHIYRGSAIPDLDGRYVFGDWSSSFGQPDGHLFVATPDDSGLWPIERLHVDGNPEGELGHFLLGFGQDRSGEIYVLTTDQSGPTGTTGMVFRMEDAGPVAAEPVPERPTTLTLEPAFPNPFTQQTTLSLSAAEPGRVIVTVYDVLGREVKTLLDTRVQPNTFQLTWDGTDGSGRRASSGVYFVQVRSDGAVQTRSVTLVR